MVEVQLRRRGISDKAVLEAFSIVPREAFISEELAQSAYEDHPLPIGEGQTISQPYVVALMAEAARLGRGSRVLEVGAGSGYAAAIYSRVSREVITIERHHTLVEHARRAIGRLGYGNIEVVEGDGSLGHPDRGPYDAILVAAGAPAPPPSLKEQLADGGRLVIPVSVDSHQDLKVITRQGDSYREESLGGVRFVPLLGQEGWQ
jgi:protein-L-isoaspartate(D-aspartate) O-methyltransferase